MPPVLTEINSFLGIEIGSLFTRAVLFDVVEESYQFIATGSAPSTHNEPYFDVTIGVIEAVNHLQEITGKYFLDLNQRLIIPSHGSSEGVDKLVITLSCGCDLNVVTFGLFNDISLETANLLVRTAPLNLVDCFGINDKRTRQDQIDALLNNKPDLIILAGGSDRGANKSILRMANTIATSLELLPKESRPKVLFCGNHAMTKRVKEILEKTTYIQGTNNIKPEIDKNDLHKASIDLTQLILEEQKERIVGLERLTSLCSDQPMLTGIGFKRIIQFLGRQFDPQRGVLGIDIGSTHTIAAFANHKDCAISTSPVGTSVGIEQLLRNTSYREIEKWLPDSLSESEVMGYLWQKTIFPTSQPESTSELSIELAVMRLILSTSLRNLTERYPLSTKCFEPILVGGSLITHNAAAWQILLTILDGLQPVGMTPIVIDKHGILSLLGATARINPLLPVQVLESTSFVNLATVVVVESHAKPSEIILEGYLQTPSGYRRELIVRQGSLASLPLAFGEIGLLYLKPLKKTTLADIELGKGPIKVKGGICGLVFDARGRPIQLPDNNEQRRNILKLWAEQGEL